MADRNIMDSKERQSPADQRRGRERAAVIDLRRYKRERALTCARLADELGVSVDSVERYLTGKRPVPGHVVVAVIRKVAA